MKRIIAGTVTLLLFMPVANAETPIEAIAKAKTQAQLASKDAQIAKAKAQLALEKAKAAKEKAKASVKDVQVLRTETLKELQLMQKQLNALTKLLKNK